jgi:hypothetical protein
MTSTLRTSWLRHALSACLLCLAACQARPTAPVNNDGQALASMAVEPTTAEPIAAGDADPAAKTLWTGSVHQALTEQWAKEAGLSATDARRVANADNGIDNPFSFDGQFDYKLHFNRRSAAASDIGSAAKDSRVIESQRYLANAVRVWQLADRVYTTARRLKVSDPVARLARSVARNQALDEVGKALHPLQDIQAHGNITHVSAVVWSAYSTIYVGPSSSAERSYTWDHELSFRAPGQSDCYGLPVPSLMGSTTAPVRTGNPRNCQSFGVTSATDDFRYDIDWSTGRVTYRGTTGGTRLTSARDLTKTTVAAFVAAVHYTSAN